MKDFPENAEGNHRFTGTKRAAHSDSKRGSFEGLRRGAAGALRLQEPEKLGG